MNDHSKYLFSVQKYKFMIDCYVKGFFSKNIHFCPKIKKFSEINLVHNENTNNNSNSNNRMVKMLKFWNNVTTDIRLKIVHFTFRTSSTWKHTRTHTNTGESIKCLLPMACCPLPVYCILKEWTRTQFERVFDETHTQQRTWLDVNRLMLHSTARNRISWHKYNFNFKRWKNSWNKAKNAMRDRIVLATATAAATAVM